MQQIWVTFGGLARGPVDHAALCRHSMDAAAASPQQWAGSCKAPSVLMPLASIHPVIVTELRADWLGLQVDARLTV